MDIHITNLHLNVSETDLQRLFTPFGEIRSIEILRDRLSNRSRGRAIINMPVIRQAQNAIAALNGILMEGRSIGVMEVF